jgi:peroxiredoxin
MTELVQLERQADEFSKRSVRVVAVSVDSLEDTSKTQADYPHLVLVSDERQGLSTAAGLIHPNAGPNGSDTDAPTTILVDRGGIVRWLYRSPNVLERLAPEQLLRAVDKHLH